MEYFKAYFRGAQAPVSVNRHPEVGAGEVSRRYDWIFKKYGGNIPVPFLRALAYSESRLNPDYELEKGINLDGDSYWGLFQVGINNVLKGFNKRSGKTYTKEQLFDPVVNTEVATWHLRGMLEDYAEWGLRHGIQNLRPDWDNLEFVRLFVAGWNSGHSRKAGVQAAALWLKSKGIPVTHDNIFRHDGKVLKLRRGKWVEGKKTKFLNINNRPIGPRKYRWQRRVVKRFYEQRGLPPIKPPTGAGPLIAAGLATVAILALAA